MEERYTLPADVKLAKTVEALPTGDILIIAGDFTETGKLEEIVMFRTYLDALNAAGKFKFIIFIAGNHETTLDPAHYNSEGWRYHKERQDTDKCRAALLTDLPPNVHYLQDSSVMLEGLKIYG